MRLGEKGRYRRYGKLFKLVKQDKYEPVYKENPITFRFKYVEGSGMSKEEFKLFSNWIIQSGRAVIETNSLDSFEKGDKVKLDGEEYKVSRVDTHPYNSLNGRKRIVNKRTVLYCE